MMMTIGVAYSARGADICCKAVQKCSG